MEIFLLYFIVSGLISIGYLHRRSLISAILIGLLLGWLMLPISLGISFDHIDK